MKVAIIGASSFIGMRLFGALNAHYAQIAHYECIGTYFQHKKDARFIYCDITQSGEVRHLINAFMPEVILWVAGSKNLHITEQNPALAFAINTTPLTFLLQAIDDIDKKSAYRPKIIFFSTDYVFDGLRGNYRYDDMPNPKTHYGASNKAAELLLLEHYDNATIIRTSAVMGRGGTFFDFLINALHKQDSIALYDDTIFSPTPIALLLKHTLECMQSHTPPIVHICGANAYTRYSFGVMIKHSLVAKYPHKHFAHIIKADSKNDERLFFPNLSLCSSFPLDNYESEL